MLLRQLADAAIDIGIVALPIQADQIETAPLFTEDLVLVMPAQHPLARRSRVSLDDLASEPFVVLNEAHCLTGNILSFCATQDMVPFVAARSHQLLTVLELVRLGHGVSLVPEMAVRDGIDEGRIYRSLSGDTPTRTVAVAWSKARYQTRLFKRFLAYCRERLTGPKNQTRDKDGRGVVSRG